LPSLLGGPDGIGATTRDTETKQPRSGQKEVRAAGKVKNPQKSHLELDPEKKTRMKKGGKKEKE
jgi:hypothetical protein